MRSRALKSRIALSLLFALALFAALTLYADAHALAAALRAFRWELLLPLAALTGVNLFLRFLKWEYYLRLLGVRLTGQESGAIFLSNFALILTPGKVGSLLRSVFVRQASGVPVARTLPVIVAERLTDGLGMLLMTCFALVAYPAAWPVVALVLTAILLLLLVVQTRPLALWLLSLAGRVPLLARWSQQLEHFYGSSYALLRPRPLLVGSVLGTASRSLEGVVLFVVLLGMGVAPSPATFAHALFIAALSNIIGVVVMLPGGLGGTEGSMTGLLGLFVGLSAASATAATMIARLATFWLPAALGFTAMVWHRDLFLAPALPEETVPVARRGAVSVPSEA